MKTHEIRTKLGMSQREFAKYIGVPVATVRNWDSRGTMPEYVANLIERLEEALRELTYLKVCRNELFE